jgi:hypothetical protein
MPYICNTCKKEHKTGIVCKKSKEEIAEELLKDAIIYHKGIGCDLNRTQIIMIKHFLIYLTKAYNIKRR